MSEQAYGARRLRAVVSGAIEGAIMGIAIGCDLAHDEAVDALLDGLDAVPRGQHDRGLEDAEWLRAERGEARAEVARLREELARLVRAVDRLDERPFASEAAVLSDAMRHARAALHAEDGDDDE